MLLALAVIGAVCTPFVHPTATPYPTPDEVSIYLMLTDKYTSLDAIVHIYDMSADDAARVLQALQSIEPASGFEMLHEQVLDAYRYICRGKLLLPGADNLLRAEAYFMVDWGISCLLDYRQQVDKLRH